MTLATVSFAEAVARMPSLFESLMAGPPLDVRHVSRLHRAGVYLLSEEDKHLYVGRTRKLSQRYRAHCHQSSGENQAAFAFRLARIATNKVKAEYRKEGSRKDLMQDDVFVAAFTRAKLRIREMTIRFVEINDPIEQTIFEVYASLALQTEHNKFSTT